MSSVILFLVCSLLLTTPQIGEETMTIKYLTTSESGTAVSSGEMNLFNSGLWKACYDGTYYYHATVVPTVGDYHVNVERRTTLNGTVTLETTEDTGMSSSVEENAIIKYISNNLYLVYVGRDDKLYIKIKSSGSWGAAALLYDTSGANLYTLRFGDIFLLGSTIYVIYQFNGYLHCTKTDGTDYNTALPYTQSSSSGCVYDSNYVFVTQHSSNIMYESSFNGSSFSLYNTEITDAPATFGSFTNQFYYRTAYSRFFIAYRYIYNYNKTLDEWTQIYDSGSASANYAINFDINGIPTYVSVNHIMYKVFPAGAIVQIPSDINHDIYGFCNEYWIYSSTDDANNYKIGYLYKKPITVGPDSQCRSGDQIEDKCQFSNTTEDWDLTDFIVLYDSTSELILWQGFIESVGETDQVVLHSPIEEELKKEIPAATGIVSVLVDEVYQFYSEFLIPTSTDTTSTFRTWHGGTMEEFFKWARCVEGKTWGYTADFGCHYTTNFIDASKSYAYGDGKILGLTPSTKNYTVWQVHLYGNGIESIKTKSGVQNGQILTDYYPNVSDQTELDTLAANLLAKNSTKIITVEFDIIGERLDWGYYILLSYSPENVSEETYYIVNVGYDFTANTTHILATNAIVYQFETTTKPYVVSSPTLNKNPDEFITNYVQTKEITVSNSQQYKHANCLQTGTSGATAIISYTGTTCTQSTAFNHIGLTTFTNTARFQTWSYTISLGTVGWYSAWIGCHETNRNLYYYFIDSSANTIAGLHFAEDGLIYVIDKDAEGVYNLGPYSADTLYFIRFYIVSGISMSIWINEDYKYTLTADVGNFNINTVIAGHFNASTATTYHDAICFSSTSEKLVKMGYKTGPINAESIFSDYTHTDQLVAKNAKIGETGNYKGTHCINWGTTGAPTGITARVGVDTCEVLSSVAKTFRGVSTTHNYPMHCIVDNAEFVYTSSSSGIFSLWIAVAATNKQLYVGLQNSAGNWGALLLFQDDGTLNNYAFTAAAWQSIGSYSANTWIHLKIEYVAATSVRIYRDDTLVHAQFTDVPNYTIAYHKIEGGSYADEEFWVNAWYDGTDKREACKSFTDKQHDDYHLTEYGFTGYHSKQFLNKAYDRTYTASTDIDLSAYIPPLTKTVRIAVQYATTQANTGNYFTIIRYGNTDDRLNGMWHGFPSVANYWDGAMGDVEVSSDLKIRLYIHPGAGTRSVYITILGYEL